jgi:hypothetical protein
MEEKSLVRHGNFCSDSPHNLASWLRIRLEQERPYSVTKAYHDGWLLIVEDRSVSIAGLRVCIYLVP